MPVGWAGAGGCKRRMLGMRRSTKRNPAFDKKLEQTARSSKGKEPRREMRHILSAYSQDHYAVMKA